MLAVLFLACWRCWLAALALGEREDWPLSSVSPRLPGLLCWRRLRTSDKNASRNLHSHPFLEAGLCTRCAHRPGGLSCAWERVRVPLLRLCLFCGYGV